MADPRRSRRSVATAIVAWLVVFVAAGDVAGVSGARASAGALDPSFGKNGVVLTDFGAHRFDAAYGLAIQADGKIIAAGRAETSAGQRFALARYRPNGTLDPGFGRGGLVETGFGSAFQAAWDVAIQPDGRIVVAGWANVTGTTDFALARYRPNGTLDPSFGGDGRVTTSFGTGSNDRAEAVAVQPDGQIVAAGWTLSPASSPSDFALARYRSNGRLDPSFGGDGRVTTDFGGNGDRGAALALPGDGSIVVAGSSTAAADSSFALARYTSTGTLDPSFDGDGRVTTSFTAGPAEALGVAIDGGSIVAAGSVFTGPQIRDHSFALARYTPSGTLDGSFGSGGTVTTDLGAADGDNQAAALAISSGDPVVAGATSVLTSDYDHSLALARYTPGGTLDPAFGAGGAVVTNVGSGWDVARDVAVDAGGRIVVAGVAEARRGGDFVLARYLGS